MFNCYRQILFSIFSHKSALHHQMTINRLHLIIVKTAKFYCLLFCFLKDSESFLKVLFICFWESGKEGEKHWCEREILLSFLSHMSQLGIKSATQAYILTGNQTGDLSPCGMMPNQPSHAGQSLSLLVMKQLFFLYSDTVFFLKFNVSFSGILIQIHSYKNILEAIRII